MTDVKKHGVNRALDISHLYGDEKKFSTVIAWTKTT